MVLGDVWVWALLLVLVLVIANSSCGRGVISAMVALRVCGLLSFLGNNGIDFAMLVLGRRRRPLGCLSARRLRVGRIDRVKRLREVAVACPLSATGVGLAGRLFGVNGGT